MMKLSELKNTHRKKASVQRVGRGNGSGRGKTCGRGMKGAKARSGYKRRHGKEGGQLPMFKRIPIRGFSRGRFLEERFSINVQMLEKYFADGEHVTLETLKEKQILSKKVNPIVKVLGYGELTKRLIVEVDAVSESAREKIEQAKGTVKQA
jgi:large subunit ribosomal protein L15